MTAVTLDDVSAVTHGRVRLTRTSLTIPDGTITALIGPNGSGKSTLLSLIAGELAPSTGTVHLSGAALAGLSPTALARRRAVLEQSATVTFPFTVADVVSWGRHAWRGTPEAEHDTDVIEECLASQDLTALRDRRITELSGGERRRAQIARILAQRAPLVLFDEADAELDLVGRRHLDDVMRSHRDAGGTVIVTSHDVTRLARISDLVILLSGGTVLASGNPDTVLTTEMLTAAFGRRIDVEQTAMGPLIHLP